MLVPLCEPWPLPPSGCPDLTGSPPVTGFAVQVASEVLWERTGYRFGSCDVLLRPCRTDCVGQPFPYGWWSGEGWPTWNPLWDPLTPGGSLWWGAVCGRCQSGCACTSADTLLLPTLTQSVVEVVIDGEPLPPSGYALFDGDKLVRTDGERWPLCQDWTVPVSGVGAWHVVLRVGQPVPSLGMLAVAELAADVAKACNGEPCRLPAYTTSKTRQGVSQTFPSVAEMRELDLTPWPWVNEFLNTVDPHRVRAGAQIWNPDDFDRGWRRPGGAW